MFENNTIIILCGLIYLYNYFPEHWIHYLYNTYYSDWCEIQIPYHTRAYTNFTKTVIKTIYSEKFCSISYYILNNKIKDICSICEVTNCDIDRYGWESNEYILLPTNHAKIKISDNPEIYLENIIEYDTSGDSGNKNGPIKEGTKKFTYKLTMCGKKNIHILNQFLEECEKKYKLSTEKKEQMIFEYINMETDENGRKNMQFSETRFISNKRLTDNVFFEGREEFIKEIQKFPYRKLDENMNIKTAPELEYAYLGRTFKKAILLHGPPGGGKTSIIKGILHETKRHAVKIQWSRIKTCAQFSSLFNELKIRGNKYSLGELCYIFEDFDANKMEILKKRKDGYETNPLYSKPNHNEKPYDKDKIISIMNIMEDELTLDYVLNVFDGVVELHDALLIFTTNAELECFDPALIRPGRIDLIMKLGECSPKILCEVLSHYYRLSVEDVSNLLKDIQNDKRPNDKKRGGRKNTVGVFKPVTPSYIECLASKNANIIDTINELFE